MKYWEVLLINWRKQHRNGFTIPFIIGSQKFLPKVHKSQNVGALVEDIISSNNTEIYITYCTDLNDLILGVRDESKKNIAGKFPDYKGQTQTKFFVTKIADDLGKDIDQVIDSLTERYQPMIDKKEYSTNNREKGDFSSYEVSFIKSSFDELKNGSNKS